MLGLGSNPEQNAPDAPNLASPRCKRCFAAAGVLSQIIGDPTLFSDCILLSHTTFIAV
jgi:hypothetical protein